MAILDLIASVCVGGILAAALPTEARAETLIEIGIETIDIFNNTSNSRRSPLLTPPPLENAEYYKSILNENKNIHMDFVRQSEDTFYGFYSPDGFLEFDYDKCPQKWVPYSVHENFTKQCNTIENIHGSENGRRNDDSLPSTINTGNKKQQTNTMDDFISQLLDQRIIPPPFSNPHDLARVSQTPILSPDECSELISDCESQYHEWGSSNERYGTSKGQFCLIWMRCCHWSLVSKSNFRFFNHTTRTCKNGTNH